VVTTERQSANDFAGFFDRLGIKAIIAAAEWKLIATSARYGLQVDF
jgi:hypothetical protein